MIKKSLIFLFLLALISTLAFFFYLKPRLPIINGYAAKKACSCLHLADRPIDNIVKEDLAIFPLNFTKLKIGEDSKSVTASWFGESATAVLTPGLGCALKHNSKPKFLNFDRGKFITPEVLPAPESPWPEGDALITETYDNIDYDKLNTAFDLAFDSNNNWNIY